MVSGHCATWPRKEKWSWIRVKLSSREAVTRQLQQAVAKQTAPLNTETSDNDAGSPAWPGQRLWGGPAPEVDPFPVIMKCSWSRRPGLESKLGQFAKTSTDDNATGQS
jgi:hypothetical protein